MAVGIELECLLEHLARSVMGLDGVEHAAAAVAWGRVYYFDDVSDAGTEKALRDFINSFEGINNHVGA